MSYMTSAGEISAANLAQNILTLSPFKNIVKYDYKRMLQYMISLKQLELTDRKDILIGLEGEKQINHYEFYSVFETPVEFSVRYKSEEIGSVHTKFPIGYRFALAGHTWEVVDIDINKNKIFVNNVKGISTNRWITPMQVEIHTKIMKKMLTILNSNENYRYLGDTAIENLQSIRKISDKSEIIKKRIIKSSDNEYCIFTWLGTKAIIALSYALEKDGFKNKIEFYNSTIPICIIIDTCKSIDELENTINKIKIEKLDKFAFNIPSNAKIIGKFNDFIPQDLLRKQYVEDYVDINDMQKNL